MDQQALKVLFGEWLPDMPDLDNPGLTQALNVIPADGGYRPFRPFTTAPMVGSFAGTLPGTTLTANPLAGIIPLSTGGITGSAFVGTELGIYKTEGGPAKWTLKATGLTTVAAWSFTQFDNYLIAASDTNPVLFASLPNGAFATLAASGTAPPARLVSVVGRFLVLAGITGGTSTLQWNAVDDPTNWPTPGTSTAAAAQAGEQIMPLSLGPVTGIYGTDQYAIILQQGGVSRMQYVGGQVVFQFDTIDFNNGCPFPRGSIMVGGIVYYASEKGFFATDGTTVKSIGEGKTNRYFTVKIAELAGGSGSDLWCGYDVVNDVIYWAYRDEAGNTIDNLGNKVMLFHRASGRFSLAEEDVRLLITPASGRNLELNSSAGVTTPPLNAFLFGINETREFCQFAGTPETATIVTPEFEGNPGGFSHVSGVKPLIEYQSTAPAVTVALSSRNDQGDGSITYPSARTATAATGFVDFRNSARYHRAKVQITGDFKRATGIEAKTFAEGSR